MVEVFVGHDDQIGSPDSLLHPPVAILINGDRGVPLDLPVHTRVHHDPTPGIANLEYGVDALDRVVRSACDCSAQRRFEIRELEVPQRLRQITRNCTAGRPHLGEKGVAIAKTLRLYRIRVGSTHKE